MGKMALGGGYPQSGNLTNCDSPDPDPDGDVVRETDGELDLQDYLAVVRRRWRWIVGTALLVTGLVAAFSLTRDEVYESRSVVQILTRSNQVVFNVREGDLFRQAIAELQTTTGSDFADAVDERAGFDVDFTAAIVQVTEEEDEEDAGVLRFVVRAPTAEMARTGAEAASAVYLDRRLSQQVTSFTSRRDNAVEDRAELRTQRESRLEEIAAADEAVDSAASDFARAIALAERDLLVAEVAPVLDSLNSRIGEYTETVTEIDRLLAVLAEPDSTARLLNRANLPDKPISPDVPRNVMIGVVIGLLVGAVLAIMRDLLDSRPFDGAELARLVETPVMATIGEIRSERSAPGRVKRFADLSPKELQGYQVLLNSLWLSNVSDPLQSIVFSSDRAGVGKTQTVVNVAQAEASRGTRVLVIDTDFANPSVVDRLELEHRGLGLTDLLAGHASLEEVLIPTHLPTLHVIGCAQSDSASDLLRSDRLGLMLEQLSDAYDLVIIDAMPTLGTSDSRLVALQADAVVVVYDPADSRREELQLTIDLLRNSGANLVGLVANRSRASHPIYLAGQRGRDKERALL